MKNITTAILLMASMYFAYAQDNFREKKLFDFDWKFAYGHPTDVSKDYNTGTSYFSYIAKAGYGDGAASATFDDRAWRTLDLPHDWAIEEPFDPKGSHSHGYKAIGRNFPETSVGWYRKQFTIGKDDFGKQIFIDFDGVMRDAKVWVNGHYLGNEPGGYQSFSFNITDILNYGAENVIAVRADVSMEEGWYYEGAGIYRHVWLRKTNAVHTPKDGTFVHCLVENNKAILTIENEIVNKGQNTKSISYHHKILNADGQLLSSIDAEGGKLLPMQNGKSSSKINVSNPHLWSLEDPYLHTLVTQVFADGTLVDEYATKFGIRTIHFDADKGFFLNGKHIKLKGTNNHQEHAGVGAAIPDDLNEYRIKLLKSFGSNAYRCSHNPPTPELLDICDSIGMLVIDENRLMGTTDNALNEFERLIRRDRNHPSVIVWSAGNEEWAIEGNEVGARMALTMQNYAKQVDPTRPVTIAISGGRNGGILTTIEIMGSNYLAHGNTDEHHKKYPNQPFIGTEEGSTFATRGIYFNDEKNQYLPAYDLKPRDNWYTIEGCWKHYAERDYLAGMFLWTGFDYRGESTPYTWPSVLSYFGMLDLCGFPKDNVFYLKSWWQEKPVLHILPHWNWQGREGEPIDVWVYSNCEEVELFLNKKSLGKKKMDENSHLEWKVPYKKGILEAKGYAKGKLIIKNERKTAGDPLTIDMKAHKTNLTTNGQDVSVITVQVLDKEGNHVPVANQNIEFSLTGPGKIIGVGNGDPTSHENEKFIDTYEVISFPDVSIKEIDKEMLETYITGGNTGVLYEKIKEDKENRLLVSTFFIDKSISQSAKATIYFKQIAHSQTIYLNGHLIGQVAAEQDDKAAFIIDLTYLKNGENQLVVTGKPLKKKHEWDTPNIQPGSLQIVIPAKKWQRKLFNGLAQVIIQSTNDPGEIILKATSIGLKHAELKINSEKKK